MSLNVPVLEESFELIKPRANEFVTDFYANLFADYPQTRAMFAGTNMEEQKKKLLGALVLVVDNLRNPDILANAVQRLGGRHAMYGVATEHYDMVGGSLLKTFEAHLGPQWTPDVKQAWVDAYGAIAGIMQQGATSPATLDEEQHSPQLSPTGVATAALADDTTAPHAPGFFRALWMKLMRVFGGASSTPADSR